MSDELQLRGGDMLSKPWLTFLVWRAPILVLVIGGFTSPALRTALWTAAFTIMGCGCVVNAARCGRRHCYFTGPVFLAGALASLMYGVGVLPLGSRGWTWISCSVLVAYLVLRRLPERFFGTYTRPEARRSGTA